MEVSDNSSTPSLADDGDWLGISVAERDWEQALLIYFCIGLECDMPILEALYFRWQLFRVSIDRGLRWSEYKCLLNAIRIYLKTLLEKRDGWQLQWTAKPRVTDMDKAVFRNAAELSWSAHPDITETVDIHARVKGAHRHYHTLEIAFSGENVDIQKIHFPSTYGGCETTPIQRRNIASQFKALLLECISIAESGEMQRNKEYVAYNPESRSYGPVDATPIFIDESDFVPEPTWGGINFHGNTVLSRGYNGKPTYSAAILRQMVMDFPEPDSSQDNRDVGPNHFHA